MDVGPTDPGTVLLGKYRVERTLGEGGMATVLEATHISLKQPVALKLLRRDIASNPANVTRFTREAQAAARIKSPHVVRVTDVGITPDGIPFMVMERLFGSDLSDHIAERGALPLSDAADIVIQAGDALHEAHQGGIVHRDLKPANLFLSQSDGDLDVRVLDFGISKFMDNGQLTGPGLTGTHAIMGTLAYMSPEQLNSAAKTDLRTDLWAIGCIIYEMLTGRIAFPPEGGLLAQIPRVMKQDPAPIEGQPAAVVEIVRRCLAKDPAARYASILDVMVDLAPFATPRAQRALDRACQRSGRDTVQAGAGTSHGGGGGSVSPQVSAGLGGATHPGYPPHMAPRGTEPLVASSPAPQVTEINPHLQGAVSVPGADLLTGSPRRKQGRATAVGAVAAAAIVVTAGVWFAASAEDETPSPPPIALPDAKEDLPAEDQKHALVGEDPAGARADVSRCNDGEISACTRACSDGESEACSTRDRLQSQKTCLTEMKAEDCKAFVSAYCDDAADPPSACGEASKLAQTRRPPSRPYSPPPPPRPKPPPPPPPARPVPRTPIPLPPPRPSGPVRLPD